MHHIIILILIYITCFPYLDGQAKKVYPFDKIEQEMLSLVNDARKEQGLRPLEFHPVLNDVALKHSQKMAAEGKLSHYFPNYKKLHERLMDTELPFIKSGENVAYSEDPDAKFVHDGFMSSTGHRQNILDPDYTHCGIKFVHAGNNFFITQEFARIYLMLTGEEMESVLEQDAADRYREVFNSPLLFYSQLKSYARGASKLSARDEKLDTYLSTLTDQWGVIQVINVISPDQEQIKLALAKEFTARKHSGAAIGVTFIRTPGNPGGAYSVSVLFVKGMQVDWTLDQFKQIFLDEINQVRKKNGHGVVTLDKRFIEIKFPLPGVDPAAWEKRFYLQLSSIYGKKIGDKLKIKIFNYTAYDPREIPAGILETLGKGNDNLDKIGILIHRSGNAAGSSESADYFLVTLIFPGL
jgi:uncharacterized protein YkwD